MQVSWGCTAVVTGPSWECTAVVTEPSWPSLCSSHNVRKLTCTYNTISRISLATGTGESTRSIHTGGNRGTIITVISTLVNI